MTHKFYGLPVAAVLATVLSLCAPVAAQQSKRPSASEREAKPGHFRILLTRDEKICKAVQAEANRETITGGAPRFVAFREVPVWQDVDVSAPGMDKGDVTYAFFDLNGDGGEDAVFKTRSSLRGVKVEALYVLSKVDALELLKSGVTLQAIWSKGKAIDFGAPNWLKREAATYGARGDKFFYTGSSVFRTSSLGGKLFLIAWNPYEGRDGPGKVLAFSVQNNFEIKELCVLGRVCPCGGCSDPPPGRIPELDPATVWCKRPN